MEIGGRRGRKKRGGGQNFLREEAPSKVFFLRLGSLKEEEACMYLFTFLLSLSLSPFTMP